MRGDDERRGPGGGGEGFPLLHENRERRRSGTYPPQVQLSLGRSRRRIPRQMAHIHRSDHSNLEISPQSPAKPFPLLFQMLTPLSPTFRSVL